MKSFNDLVFDIVAKIPYGRVVTYGQIARALESPRSARQVGWAMHRCPAGMPWHRVINGRGQVSLPDPAGALQRALLQDEGVCFDERGWVSLRRYAWDILVNGNE